MSVKQDIVASPMQETPKHSPNVAKALSANMTLFFQLLGLGVALWAPLIVIMIWMSGNFTEMRADIADLGIEIANLETRLTAQINELDSRLTAQINELDSRLTAQINELDSRLTARIDAVDAKIVAIGDMTVIAFTDGEITGDELAAIWKRAGGD